MRYKRIVLCRECIRILDTLSSSTKNDNGIHFVCLCVYINIFLTTVFLYDIINKMPTRVSSSFTWVTQWPFQALGTPEKINISQDSNCRFCLIWFDLVFDFCFVSILLYEYLPDSFDFFFELNFPYHISYVFNWFK